MSAEQNDLRGKIIATVVAQAAAKGGVLTSTELAAIRVDGQEFRAIDRGKGIWNPTWLDATLSVVSDPHGPYEDREVEGGLIHYAYQAGSIEGTNAKLRAAWRLQRPIIFLKKIGVGLYMPLAPVYVVGDDRDRREFRIDLEWDSPFDVDDELVSDLQRRYAERRIRQRLHQAEFRTRVIMAYSTRCAICTLRHAPLLDAAHITRDGEAHGMPMVSNGLALCKIHHAAYDQNFLGISPEYRVHVDRDLLEEVDGPMLKHGIQEMHGRLLNVPAKKKERPDQHRLSERFDRFVKRASVLSGSS